MIDIAILRAMAAAGAPVDAILAAIEADQMAERARVQARRTADAERQRRNRVTRSHADSNGQAVTPRDSRDVAGSYLSSLSSSQTSEIKKEKKESKKERARKTQLPDDWEPKASHYAKGDRTFVDRKAEDLRNWAKSKAVLRADWDATFHGFLSPEKQRQSNGTGSSSLAGVDGLIAREKARTGVDDGPLLDLTPTSSRTS